MPTSTQPYPLKGLDDRDSLSIGPEFLTDMRGVRFRRGKVVKTGGLTRAGAKDAFSGELLRGIAVAEGPNNNGVVIGIGDDLLRTYNGTTWAANISGSPRASVPVPIQSSKHSVISITGKTLINPSGNVGSADNIVVYDPSLTSPSDLVTLAHGIPDIDNICSESMIAFANRAILIHTYTDASGVVVENSTQIRWSVNGDPTDFLPNNATTGVETGAGVLEIIETSGAELTGGFVVGDRAFLTKYNEILEIVSTGEVTPTFRVFPRVPGIGMPGPFMHAVVDGVVFFLGGDLNVYVFDGSGVKPVGDRVRQTIEDFAWLTGTHFVRRMLTMQHVPDREEIWLFREGLATEASNNRILAYDYRRDSWHLDGFGMALTVSLPSARLGLGNNIFEEDNILLMADVNRDTAFQLDDTVNSREDEDATEVAFESYIETKDFVSVITVGNVFKKEVQDISQQGVLTEVAFRGVPDATIEVWASARKGVALSVTAVLAEGDKAAAEITSIDSNSLLTPPVDFGLEGFLPGMSVNIARIAAAYDEDVIVRHVFGNTMQFTTALGSALPDVPATGTTPKMTITGDSWWKTTAIVNKDGVGRAFFILPFSKVRLRFYTNTTDAFELQGVFNYRWDEAGPNYPGTA